MIAFYDPQNNNQVQAIYTGDTTSQVWEQRGYLKARVPAQFQGVISREHRVDVSEGVVTNISAQPNAIQPTEAPNTNQDLIDDLQPLPNTVVKRALLRLLGN